MTMSCVCFHTSQPQTCKTILFFVDLYKCNVAKKWGGGGGGGLGQGLELAPAPGAQ